jgi:hypothetical protein
MHLITGTTPLAGVQSGWDLYAFLVERYCLPADPVELPPKLLQAYRATAWLACLSDCAIQAVACWPMAEVLLAFRALYAGMDRVMQPEFKPIIDTLTDWRGPHRVPYWDAIAPNHLVAAMWAAANVSALLNDSLPAAADEARGAGEGERRLRERFLSPLASNPPPRPDLLLWDARESLAGLYSAGLRLAAAEEGRPSKGSRVGLLTAAAENIRAVIRDLREEAPVPAGDVSAFDAGRWDEGSLSDQERIVRRLLGFMRHLPHAHLSAVCPAVWNEDDADVGENAIKSALYKANAFLETQPTCRLRLSKDRGESVLRWG